MTNKLLLEAGFTRFMFRGGTTGRPAPDGIIDLIPVTEQSTAINPATGLPYAPRANFVYRGVATANPNYANPNNWRASASYVTGSHEMKVGYQGRLHPGQQTGSSSTSRSWPTASTRRAEPVHVPPAGVAPVRSHGHSGAVRPGQVDARPADAAGRVALRPRLELYPGGVQRDGSDVTIQRGADQLPADARRRSFNDITPRFGAAYDVFGNGKTALKFNVGHYLDSATNDSEYTQQQPGRAHRPHGTRNWDDRIFPSAIHGGTTRSSTATS